MIKKTIATMAITTAALLTAGTAQADINADLQNICTIVKTNDKSQLRKKIKMVKADYSMKFGDVYPGITCGGKSLIRTAVLNDAVDTGTLLIKRLPKKMLAGAEQDGKTLTDWATEAGVNGSPIIAALNERI